MKSSIIKKIFTLTLLAITLTGCVIVFNQPSAEEKELMSIQQDVGKQVKEISGKINANGNNWDEMTYYVQKGQDAIKEGMMKIEAMRLPEKAKASTNATIAYLESLQQNLEKIKGLLKNISDLNDRGKQLTAQAKSELQTQVNNLRSTLMTVANQMDNILGGLDKIGEQMKTQYQAK